MKNTKRIICLTLAILLLFSLTSCKGALSGGDVVMTYGDKTLNESDYLYIASMVKRIYFSQFGVRLNEKDINEILNMDYGKDGKTVADFLNGEIQKTCKKILIIETLCDKAGLEITDEKVLGIIKDNMADLEFAYGGKDMFEIELAKMGFTRESVKRLFEFFALESLFIDYRYGEKGTAKIPASEVTEKFLSDYIRYEGCCFSYVNLDKDHKNEKKLFDFTDEEIKEYFNSNYVKVKHVLFQTADAHGNEFSDEKKAKAKADAEKALESIINGEKTLDDYKTVSSDNGYIYTFTYGDMLKEFEEKAFEIKVDDVAMVKTEYGYHIMQKLPLEESDLIGTKNDKGELKGGKKDNVIEKLSAAKIRKEANDYYEKLKSGEIKDFNKDDKDIYVYYDAASYPIESDFFAKELKDKKAEEFILKDLENYHHKESNVNYNGVYILKKAANKRENLTDDIYKNIEQKFIYDAYNKYLDSFDDQVEIDNDVISKFNIATINMVDEKFLGY